MIDTEEVVAQSSKAFQALLDASAVLVAASSQSQLLGGLLDLASSVVRADAYAVWRQSEDGYLWRAIAVRGLSSNYRTEINAVPDTPASVLLAVEDVETEPSVSRFRQEYAAEGVRSMLVIPLVLPGTSGGTLTFYWRHVHRFSSLEVNYAEALANLCSAALASGDLHEQRERERHRLGFLARASEVLASSLDYETTLNRVAQMAVPAVADWCTVHIVENGAVNRIVVAHADPAMLRMAEDYSRRFPEEIHEDRGLGAVLRSGEVEFYPYISDEMLAAAAKSPEHLGLLRDLRMTSSVLVPLISQGRVLGAIRLLAAGQQRHFTADDVQLAKDLARRAASAIENAQLHRAVLKQERELRLAHSAAKMGSWSWDLKKGQIFWSGEFKRLHGLPLDAEPGYDAGSNLVHPEDRERVLAELAAVLASNEEQITSESRVITPDGRTLTMLSQGSIYRDEAGTAEAIFGVTLDVTEQRRAEMALRRTEKLAAAGRLAATIAHEVNNPLEALTNLIYLACISDGLPAQARTYLQAAEAELTRIAQIVRQTLGFYRESANPRAMDVRDIVVEVSNLYRSRAETRSIKLSIDAEPGMQLLANAGEIRQVLANLVSNAIDATGPNGTILLRAGVDDQRILITVSDTGSGVSGANLPRLFEPFFTTKEEVGTGLGLWVSKSIIEKFNGTIEVATSTAPGQSGTSFTVILPALPHASEVGASLSPVP